VGLLGDLGDGQLQASLPDPLATLADGGHVIVLHPGLDLTTALGCGPIPATDLVPAPPPASAPPAPLPSLAGETLTPPSPRAAAPDPACVGIREWVEATDGRLDHLADLSAEADRLAALYDLPGYVAALQTFAGAAQVAAADQASGPVPDLALSANEQVLAVYAVMYEAASLYLRYYTMEMTIEVLGQAAAAYQRAQQAAGEARGETSRLTATCEGP
jgi:hypothetical protein